MSWFYQSRQPVVTKHNGTMMLSRFLGTWTLWGHDGTFQGAPYMDGVWKKTVRHLLRRGFDTRRCLILGVAMGSTFNIVQKAWPDTDVVGIDWEPTLFELGKKLGVFHPGLRCTFIEGDAAKAVRDIDGPFDLILVDLFNGRKVDSAVADEAFRTTVAGLLSDGGVLAVNCYDQREMLEEWPSSLGEPTFIRYESNVIGIFGPVLRDH